MKKNYETMTAQELKTVAKEKKVKNWWNLKKAELVEALKVLEKVEEVEKEVSGKPAPKKPSKKAKEEKVDSDNLITLKELAMDLDIKGSKARRLLREAGIERPFKRWEWDQEKHDKIITEVRTLLMEEQGE